MYVRLSPDDVNEIHNASECTMKVLIPDNPNLLEICYLSGSFYHPVYNAGHVKLKH